MALTGWQRLDPLVALAVAANIIWTGVGIVRRSTAGLMDSAVSAQDLAAVERVLKSHEQAGLQFHKLQTRQAGATKFVSVHVQVPGGWTVDRGHQAAGRIASDIRQALPEASIITHLEPQAAPTPTDSTPHPHDQPHSRGHANSAGRRRANCPPRSFPCFSPSLYGGTYTFIAVGMPMIVR